MTASNISISIHLGENAPARRRALETLAAEAGYFWNDKPSIGRWACAQADEQIEKEKTMTKYILQTVVGAYGPGDDVPWHNAHEKIFCSYRAAKDAMDADVADMRERCGTGWDSHCRIVPTADTEIAFEFHCLGPIGGPGCQRFAEATVTVAWPAGEPLPPSPNPPGWDHSWLCPECSRIEQAREQEWEREQDKLEQANQ